MPVGVTADDEMHNMDIGPARRDGINRLYIAVSGGNKVYECSWVNANWQCAIMVSLLGATDVIIGDGRNDGVTRMYVTWMNGLTEFTWTGSAWSQVTIDSVAGWAHGNDLGQGRNDGINRIYTANQGNGQVYEYSWNGAAWTRLLMGSTSDSRNIEVGQGRNDGTYRVYVPSGDSNVYEFTWTGSSWQKLSMGNAGSGGVKVHSIPATARSDDWVRIYAASSDGGVDEYTWTGTAWQTLRLGRATAYMYGLAKGDGLNKGTTQIYGSSYDGQAYLFEWVPAAPTDTQAPTAPTGLAATGSLSSASLTWAASSDNVGVTIYNVHRSTQPAFTVSAANRIAQTANTSYLDSGLAPATYYYRVTAQDAAVNVSSSSNEDDATVTGDTTPPTVTATAPANGATGVSTATSATVTFNEAMDATTIGTSTFELRNAADTLVPAVVTYNSAARTATLAPNAALTNGTVYTATVKGGATDPRVKDAAGNALAANFTWSFTTAAESTPPTVTTVTPANGATGVSTATSATVTFNEAMDATTIGSATFELRNSSNGLVPAGVTYSSATRTATLAPNAALANGAVYTATVKGGATDPRVKDAAGNALAANFTWSFTTVGETTPPTVTTVTPANGATGVSTATSATVTFNEAMDATTIGTATFELRNSSNVLVPAGVTYSSATRTATLAPNAALANGAVYTATVTGGATDPRVKDAAGNALAANFTWSFTTVAAPTGNCPCSIWSPTATPERIATSDISAVEIGVKFRADVNGSITALRYYKGSTNTGTHVGHLWTTTGTLLSTATFTGETASGWQQVNLPSPVNITANTTYIASYYSPNGRYAFSNPYFTTSFDSPPLHALSNGAGNGNGVYRYGSGGGFPTSSFGSSNYWVDVVFQPSATDSTPPTITATSPANGATGVSTGTSATVTFNEAMDAATIGSATFELRNSSNVLVPAGVTYSTATRIATLAPTAALASGMTYTATVRGGATDPRVKDAAGNALAANFTWSFSTVADTTPPTITATSPANGATGVSTGTSATVTFNEAMDAATIGSATFELRNSSNVLVPAGVTYSTATRTATLAPTAALASGMTYTATVMGGATDPRVKDAAGNALAANFTWSFTTVAESTPPTVTTVTPANSATGVSTATSATVTFNEAMDAATIGSATFELRNSSNVLVPAGVTYSTATRTATLAPTAALASGMTYTATVRGGATDPRVKDAAGNALAANFTWSFTTVAESTPPTVTTVTPANSATGVSTATSATVTFNEAMDAATIGSATFELRNSSNVLVPAGVTYSTATRTATLAPTAALASGMTYTATVRGGATDPRVKDAAGNALAANFTWSFTTVAAPTGSCPCSIWSPTATPSRIETTDTASVELGVRFRADVNGSITGLRFYKGSSSTGTHTGKLWSNTGTLLASLTFTNETASGWQQASFATPVAITANTTYVASYHTNVGNYAVTESYFTTAVNNPPLRAPAHVAGAANGVYRYGASAFPNQTYNTSNYWVDVVFVPTP